MASLSDSNSYENHLHRLLYSQFEVYFYYVEISWVRGGHDGVRVKRATSYLNA